MTISPPAVREATATPESTVDETAHHGGAVSSRDPGVSLMSKLQGDASSAAGGPRRRTGCGPHPPALVARGRGRRLVPVRACSASLSGSWRTSACSAPVRRAFAAAELYADLREQLALGTVPLGGQVAPGSPVALIDIPAAGVDDLVVVEGTTTGQLAKGPGHRRDTPLPGQPGVSVLLGRAVTAGGVFHAVPTLAGGDVVTVTTGQGAFTYRVERVRRAGDPLPQPLAAGGARLTLVTTETAGWRSGWAPEGVVYVDATLVGQTQPGPAHAAAVGVAEEAMAEDQTAVLPTILWLQLLLVSLVAIVWSAARWGVLQTWIVGLPLVLAALWGLSSSAAQLLPNLM